MTKAEIIRNFPFSIGQYGHCYGKMGVCTLCEYFETCDKLLPGFIKPLKCEGPFFKDK